MIRLTVLRPPSNVLRLGIAALAGGLLGLAITAATPLAHIAYDDFGQFRHQSHSRDLNFFNSVDNYGWRQEARDAQLDWHGTMGGSLRFYTTDHAKSTIHMVDAYYNTTWIGYAYDWSYHGGHGHAQMNLKYDYVSRRTMRQVSCHEIGHFTGLAHSSDASDCMVTPANPNLSVGISNAHRDQLRQQWNFAGHGSG